jgi:hypothetical protein
MNPLKIALAREADMLLAQYLKTPSEKLRLKVIKANACCTLAEGSHNRAEALLDRIQHAPPEIFWPTFIDDWAFTEVAWNYRSAFLPLMRVYKPSLRKYLPPEIREATDALPDLVTVYRGCAREHVRGIAWTTSPKVAEFFAVTNRWAGLAPDRVIASAIIPREHVFYATDERNEAEVILDPKRLRRIVIHSRAAAVDHFDTVTRIASAHPIEAAITCPI